MAFVGGSLPTGTGRHASQMGMVTFFFMHASRDLSPALPARDRFLWVKVCSTV